MRPLLRWTSLVGCAAVLAAFGVDRTHQQNFPLFLTAVLAVSVVAVVVFVLTGSRDET